MDHNAFNVSLKDDKFQLRMIRKAKMKKKKVET